MPEMTGPEMTGPETMGAKPSGRSIDPMLVPLPIAFFVASFGCDLIFWMSGDGSWIAATRWLLLAGILMGFAAAIMGMIDAEEDLRHTEMAVNWWYRRGSVVALLIEAFNWYLRAGTPAEIVLPTGVFFSAAAVSVLMMTGWWARGLIAGRGLAGSRRLTSPSRR